MKNGTKLMLPTAMILSGLFCAISAMAEVAKPTEAYHSLTAVELAPENAPRLQNGVGSLSTSESRYRERLPLQLRGPISNIKRAKYTPSNRRR